MERITDFQTRSPNYFDRGEKKPPFTAPKNLYKWLYEYNVTQSNACIKFYLRRVQGPMQRGHRAGICNQIITHRFPDGGQRVRYIGKEKKTRANITKGHIISNREFFDQVKLVVSLALNLAMSGG